ncbi:Oidioi.mRNA.OKI2018_I69.chr1.g2938.t1.cds [Oikopleura dioica]|uniref:Oidioi.mRNA.OKI2018_I69.chr1.g2938.t1.cds n=1 Tax=Oikopleura dioica TaxID=34765 RepID=A0ABN7SWU9_OIKDI|nr:Oidioi.mRNA.OKI2018_I69.chr1.g2938.t1.cds [Oikopleura dioica]
MTHCYRCIGMDYGCDPLNSAYTVVIDADSYELTCEQNTDPCALNACMCDLDLVNNLVQNIAEEGSNLNGLTEATGFDTQARCIPGNNPGPKADQCCGEYPKRFPFSDNYGQRGCCSGKTYNTNTLECCAGGEIKGIGYCGGY